MRSRARLSIAASLAAAIALLIDSGHAAGSAQDPAEALTLRMIVVSSAEAAQRIVERLNGGESFAALAKTESTGPGADGGGWLGKVTLSQLRPEVRRAVQGVRPGNLAPVVRIPTGFAIVKVEEDDPSTGAAAVTPALASSGAVKYMYDVSGFTEARVSLEMFGMAAFPNDGLMDHSLRTALIGRDGKLVANIEGNKYSPDQLADLTQAVLTTRSGNPLRK